MIDIKDLRANPEAYKSSAQERGVKVDIEELLALDERWLKLIRQVEELRSQLKTTGKPTAGQLKQLQETKAELGRLEDQLKTTEEKHADLLLGVPNKLAPDTPTGGEEASRQERAWGDTAKPGFELKDHVTLAGERGWLDFERGAKVAGNKFYYLLGPLVKLEMALSRYVIDKLEKAGFQPMIVPHMVTSRIAAGTGYMPRGEERQIYKIEGEDLTLIATAEIPIAGFHADEILEASQLPLWYAGISPSYRMEAGAYGKYSKGLYRVHQWNKVEMFAFCRPEESEKVHERLVGVEEEICQELGLPYRVIRIAAGDLGASAYKKFDLEYWSPVEQQYRELMSCSNCTDFQARRLNIRFRNNEGKLQYAHTLNGTAAAFSRMPIAILENHQQVDGSIKLPRVLHNYYGGGEL
jgi:seryl-tRNA synthetase